MSDRDENASREHNRALRVLCAVYLALLMWIILWKVELPHLGDGSLRVIKLVPFFATGEAGASAPLEVGVNFALFIPFGVYLGLLAPAIRWGRVALTTFGASLALEITQYALALGSSDVTDLVANTAGGFLGFGLLLLARRVLRHRATRVMWRVCAVGTVLLLVLVVLWVVSPLRYAPPSPSTGSALTAAASTCGTVGTPSARNT